MHVADNSGAVDLGNINSDQKTTNTDEGATEDQRRTVLTAFLVLVGEDGNPEVLAFENPEIKVLTPPNSDLIYGAVQVIAKDMAAQETAHASAVATAQVMVQQARAMAEQQQMSQMAAGLGNIRG